jgi:hypothetical protein
MRRKRRQLLLIGPDGGTGGNQPLGKLADVRAALAGYNTSEDGSPPTTYGLLRLFGPGYSIDLATSSDPVTQAITTLTDEDIAWRVLERLCRATRWRLMDMESGRVMQW